MSTKEGTKDHETREFTKRVLLSLANDLVALQVATEAIVTKIRALAIEHDVELQDVA